MPFVLKNHFVALSTLLLLLLPALGLAQASQGIELQENPARQVHWAMGAFFGSGWYQVDNNRSLFIFRLPIRQTLKTASLNPASQRQLGIEILYPLTFGLHQLGNIPDFIDLNNFGTISFTPGIEVEVPVTEKWALRPYVHFGWGSELKTHESAWIYYGGIKSRYRLGNGKHRWALLNGLYFAGYQPEFKKRGRFGSFMTGTEYSLPLNGLKIGDGNLWLDSHLTYGYFFDKLNFHIEDNLAVSVSDQWELGLALSRGQKKIKIGFLSFEHIGLSYKWSSNGHYRAIAVNVRSPFTF